VKIGLSGVGKRCIRLSVIKHILECVTLREAVSYTPESCSLWSLNASSTAMLGRLANESGLVVECYPRVSPTTRAGSIRRVLERCSEM
jgi:hypothetical protein